MHATAKQVCITDSKSKISLPQGAGQVRNRGLCLGWL